MTIACVKSPSKLNWTLTLSKEIKMTYKLESIMNIEGRALKNYLKKSLIYRELP